MNWPEVYMCSPHPESPAYLPPHPMPLRCPRAPALGTLLFIYGILKYNNCDPTCRAAKESQI